MKIKKLKLIGTIALTFILIVITINAASITPKVALRTYLFKQGHPIIAFITPITDDELHNNLTNKNQDLESGKNQNIHYYTIAIPPREKATGGYLCNYAVKKEGFFYFAQFYGEA